jgi:hypothetical protein
MATTSEARALPFFTDLQGLPLASGFIYIGQAGLDPVAYPVSVTSDIAGSTVIAQPIRTTNGHAVSAGALVHLFCPIPYSITILDSAGRLVYASLNETDPIAIAQSTSSVQTADSVADLRSRDKNSTNQVYIDGFGMYVYVPTDTTSPESLPTVVVGNDGGRYHLSLQYINSTWVKAVGPAPVSSQGAWLSYDDDNNNSLYLTCNHGQLHGGIVIRTVSTTGAETGRISISEFGAMTTGGGITAGAGINSSGDINSAGNIIAQGNVTAASGALIMVPDGSRYIRWNAGSAKYELPSADMSVNGSLVMTQGTLSGNQLGNALGSVALGNTTSPQPVLPGTWVQTGTAQGGVVLWVRTA